MKFQGQEAGQWRSMDNKMIRLKFCYHALKKRNQVRKTHTKMHVKRKHVFINLSADHLQSFHSALLPTPTHWLSRKSHFLSNAAYWKNPKDSSDEQISKSHYQFFALRNTPSIWSAADKFSVSSIIIKHTQRHSVFPRIQLGWHWIGDSAQAPIGTVPLHLNYHVPSLCSSQLASPPNSLWITGHCPFTPCLTLSQLIGCLLSLETGSSASRFQSGKVAGNP